MRFLIIHQLDNPTHQAMAAEAALVRSLMQHDPAVLASDALLTSSHLQQQTPAARILLTHGAAPDVIDPWLGTPAHGSSFLLIDVADHAAAVAWATQWPARDADSLIEVRAVGCPGGVNCVSGNIPSDAPTDTHHFMVIIHEENQIADGVIPTQHVLDRMERHNIESVEAGIMLAGHGLHPSPDGTRIKFTGGKSNVIDGPFSESKELIAGYWLIQAQDRFDAIAWAKNYPYPVMHSATISVIPVVGVDGLVG